LVREVVVHVVEPLGARDADDLVRRGQAVVKGQRINSAQLRLNLSSFELRSGDKWDMTSVGTGCQTGDKQLKVKLKQKLAGGKGLPLLLRQGPQLQHVTHPSPQLPRHLGHSHSPDATASSMSVKQGHLCNTH